jgi:hypothetical protein
MSKHPLNLFIRFILEMAALVSFGLWGWTLAEGWKGYLPAIGIPVVLVAIWGIFAVPNDPSRSGKAPVPTPGIIRLIFEFIFFAFAAWCFFERDYIYQGYIFSAVTLLHYAFSFDRIKWLLGRASRTQ